MTRVLRGAELPHWTGDDASYGAVHHRLRAERGRAADHLCEMCGKRAAEWAYDHRDPSPKVSDEGMPYSTDLAHYQPLCRSCHRADDLARRGCSPHGTEAGYYRHRRVTKTPACVPCKRAHAAATARRKARRLADPDAEVAS